MKKDKVFGPFDWFLIIGIIASSIVYSIANNEIDIIGTIVSITGIICVVLGAKGYLSNYIFGLINVALYAYISFQSKLWGAAALNGLYYLPMEFIGFFSWRKRLQEGSDNLVAPRFLTNKARIWISLATVALIAVCGWILSKFGDPKPYQDSASAMLCVVAMLLMVKAYSEQWLLWNISNAIYLIMWISLFIKGEPHSGMMVLMWVFYFINSIRGQILWNKMARDFEDKQSQSQ